MKNLGGIAFALSMMQVGARVAREGWNGKGMFLYLVGADSYPARSTVAKAHWGDDALVPYKAYVAMKTVDDEVVPWLCSQTDLLAEDWMTLDEYLLPDVGERAIENLDPSEQGGFRVSIPTPQIPLPEGFEQFAGTKTVYAKPMTRGEWCTMRGWEVRNEDGEYPDDDGYLVEYTDGGKPNVEGFDGYISWSPADVFERAYSPNA